jgi:hypothetical protein
MSNCWWCWQDSPFTLTTCMEPGTNFLDCVFYRTALGPAFLDLARAPVDNIVPMCLDVRICGIIETSNELVGQKRSILFRQSQYFSHFFSGYTHVDTILRLSRP